MNFDFLPQLPNSRLDDRNFDDLVEECLLRIPRYCPEWTDHNVSDPGITLVELFAWLTDQMLMRFNQIPRKNYVAFLELLGICLQPPAPAQVRLTFYLSTHLLENYTIPRGTEVATERTETHEAIIFTTDRDLRIGKPTIKHILSAPATGDTPRSLLDRTEQWHRQHNGLAVTREFELFPQKPQSGNSFYLVIEPDPSLEGNVLAIAFTGASGTPTGIDPKHPPRSWSAWDGESWVKVLLQEAHDTTNGFSFNENTADNDSFEQSGDVILHLPERLPTQSFNGYKGHWIRCTLSDSHSLPGYANSPRIKTIAMRSIGGAVQASQCVLVEEEILGTSNGKPGQSFEVETAPILEQQGEEQLLVLPLGKPAESWQKVEDFAESKPHHRHYVVDALAGTIQFGPLVREPQTLKRQTQARASLQQALPAERSPSQNLHEHIIEQQYGAIPPRGAEIMFTYRTGGGKQGNVQANALRFMKTAIPYVDRVTNHHTAVNGADAESLERAVLRVPQILRSQERAVTAADFEALTLKGSGGAIARASTLPTSANRAAGSVSVCVVPQANTDLIDLGRGMAPDNFDLNSALRESSLRLYLNERRLLGTQVQLEQPNYVGVSVQAEITLEPAYNNPSAQAEIIHKVKVALYRYLNPLTGGSEMTGWSFGRPLYPSDIMVILQQIAGIQYLGAILLFPIQKNGESWHRQTTPVSYIDPGSLGLLCSWADPQARTGHSVNVVTDRICNEDLRYGVNIYLQIS